MSNRSIPLFRVTYGQDGSSRAPTPWHATDAGARLAEGGEQYLSSNHPASGKSRALMFIALDKLAIRNSSSDHVVPEKAIGASFHDEPLSQFVSGPTGRSSRMEPLRRTGTTMAQGGGGEGVSGDVTRCWSALTLPSDSPSKGLAWRRSTIG